MTFGLVTGSRAPATLFARIFPVFAIVTILNFLVFYGLSLHLGGDAVNGKRVAGRYYLFGHNWHTGKKGYTEVSRAVYRYSTWHVYSIFVTYAVMIAGALVLQRERRAPPGGG